MTNDLHGTSIIYVAFIRSLCWSVPTWNSLLLKLHITLYVQRTFSANIKWKIKVIFMLKAGVQYWLKLWNQVYQLLTIIEKKLAMLISTINMVDVDKWSKINCFLNKAIWHWQYLDIQCSKEWLDFAHCSMYLFKHHCWSLRSIAFCLWRKFSFSKEMWMVLVLFNGGGFFMMVFGWSFSFWNN